VTARRVIYHFDVAGESNLMIMLIKTR
jgi:hypothetical protein